MTYENFEHEADIGVMRIGKTVNNSEINIHRNSFIGLKAISCERIRICNIDDSCLSNSLSEGKDIYSSDAIISSRQESERLKVFVW